MEIRLGEADKPEILRYLEYRNQEITESLNRQIEYGMDMVNQAASFRYVQKEFAMVCDAFPKELAFLCGEDIKKHLMDCHTIILFAATLGANVELAIRRAGVKNVADAVIMDACASTLIEAYCDSIDSDIRQKYEGQYLTTRFSPGYGDLPIEVQIPFTALLDTTRKIGVGVSESKVMIPRKSVTAIIGVSDREIRKESSCKGCNHIKACRFLRKGVTCGR